MKFFQLKITLGLALGESWPLLAQPQKNTDVYKGMLPWDGFPRQTCKNYIPWAKTRMPWEGTPWHWSKHVKIRLFWIMNVPHRLCFFAHQSNCNLATSWHIEFSILSLPHLSISIHLRIRFGCSMKLFELKITLGLALGESRLLLAQPQKNTDVQCLALPTFVGRFS